MRLLKTMTFTTIGLLIVVPALAGAANPAALLSLQAAASDAAAPGAAKASNHTTAFVLAGIGLAGVVAGAVALGSSDNGTPASA